MQKKYINFSDFLLIFKPVDLKFIFLGGIFSSGLKFLLLELISQSWMVQPSLQHDPEEQQKVNWRDNIFFDKIL